MTTTMSNLPSDLVEEIVSRVTLKSMRAVRLTRKNWNTLSKSQSFTKMYITKGEPQIIVMMDHDLYLMGNIIDPSTKHLGELTCLNEQVKISQVCHCEGLLLLRTLKDDITRFVVWNPYSAETRWVEPRYTYHIHDRKRYAYALGYVNNKNESCRSHKILRYIYNHYQGTNLSLWFEMYDFDSDSWRRLDDTLLWRIACGDLGVSLKGNTYWCTRNSSGDSVHIICFDFTTERFRPLLSQPFTDWEPQPVTLSCVREEKLAALSWRCRSYAIEIWITTKIEAEMASWSKFLILTVADIPVSIFVSFFIDEEKKKAAMVFDSHTVCIIGEDGYFKEVDLGVPADGRTPRVCSYVPSLMQIKQPTRRQTKKF